ncbi:LytTR family transcriptional regulator DNA-binding domain-containing protein [Lactobacillus sp. Marseille-P7033]|nr:LytTR family transcriptional regulator DNA-binding domain-containing protein [Lactobacillus sp. Marseille-P7033]NGC78575.1 LytTR family transcriptional regulator [Limosilactobacillus reuteri]
MKINYFESNSTNSHSAILSTVNNQQRQLNYNLRDIKKLDDRFFRAHRSYLVNLKQIDHVDLRKGTIYFYNGATCPVSKLHIRKLLGRIN